MDVALSTSTNLSRDAVTPQSSPNVAQSASPPPAAPLETAMAVLSPAQATLVRLLSDAVRNATALQGGLAALLTDLVQAQTIVMIPPEVRAAITSVIDTTAPLQALPTDAEITDALLKAGTPATSGAPASAELVSTGTAPLPAPADIRASLQTLQQALQQWAPEATTSQAVQSPQTQSQQLTPSQTPAASVPTTTAEAVPPGLPAPAAQAAPQVPLQGAPPTLTPPFQGAVQAQVASVQASPGQKTVPPQLTTQTATIPSAIALPQLQAQVALASDLGDAMASLLLLQQSARSVTQAALRPRAPTARADEAAPHKSDVPQGTNASLPLPKSQGRGLEPLSAVTRWPSQPDAAFVARTLATRTENALTQVKLLEVATQMQRTEQRQTTASPEPRWSFDIPFQTPQGQSKAHFEIDRDTYKAAGNKDARVWRVRFSIDVEPLGPVHTQIALMGKNAWVSIVAERESSMRTLESQRQALLQGFGAQDISAEVICGVGKAPVRTSAAAAGKLLDSAV